MYKVSLLVMRFGIYLVARQISCRMIGHGARVLDVAYTGELGAYANRFCLWESGGRALMMEALRSPRKYTQSANLNCWSVQLHSSS